MVDGSKTLLKVAYGDIAKCKRTAYYR